MAICITCAHPISHLYTVYESAYNLRLEQCSKCLAFADPYVEHDTLTLLLDLILLKRGVYRHLLYNRGTEPRKAHEKTKTPPADAQPKDANVTARQNALAREKARWLHILELGSGLVLVDAFIRWAQLNPQVAAGLSQWSADTNEVFLRILVACSIETVAFHVGVVLASYVVLGLSDWFRSWKAFRPSEVSGIRQQFMMSHVPLAIIYSSFTKSFLLFLLSIWRPSLSLPGRGPYRFDTPYENPWILGALEVWDEDKLDREWVVRNVLGGMAAGFGLRVVLDCHPVFTTMVILVGWVVKTAVAEALKDWVGADPQTGEIWLAYSIPVTGLRPETSDTPMVLARVQQSCPYLHWMAPGETSSSRALNAILPLVASGQPYEAHQKARTFASRYSKAGQYDTAIDVLFQSARELLKTGQQGSGTDLALFLLDVYESKGESVSDESRGRVTQLIALTGSSGTWRKTIIDRAVAWTAKQGTYPLGDPNLHHYISELLYKEGTYDAAESHLLASGKRDSARLLAQMMVDWCAVGGIPGNFALRGTLPYLENGNILAARTFIVKFVNKITAARPSLLSPLQVSPLQVTDSSEVVLTTDNVLNFCQLAVLACQRANAEKNRMMRESWIRLCGTYQSKGGVLASKEVRSALIEIAALYFAIPPPRAQPDNPLGAMLSSMLSGGAPGSAPQRRVLTPGLTGPTAPGLD